MDGERPPVEPSQRTCQEWKAHTSELGVEQRSGGVKSMVVAEAALEGSAELTVVEQEATRMLTALHAQGKMDSGTGCWRSRLEGGIHPGLG